MLLPPIPAHVKWEVWQVEWPHSDGGSKARPAVLISSNLHNLNEDKLWFIKVTKSMIRGTKYKIEVDPNAEEFKGSGLDKKCTIYPEIVRQIPKNKARYRRGAILDPGIRHKIQQAIVKTTGIIP